MKTIRIFISAWQEPRTGIALFPSNHGQNPFAMLGCGRIRGALGGHPRLRSPIRVIVEGRTEMQHHGILPATADFYHTEIL